MNMSRILRLASAAWKWNLSNALFATNEDQRQLCLERNRGSGGRSRTATLGTAQCGRVSATAGRPENVAATALSVGIGRSHGTCVKRKSR